MHIIGHEHAQKCWNAPWTEGRHCRARTPNRQHSNAPQASHSSSSMVGHQMLSSPDIAVEHRIRLFGTCHEDLKPQRARITSSCVHTTTTAAELKPYENELEHSIEATDGTQTRLRRRAQPQAWTAINALEPKQPRSPSSAQMPRTTAHEGHRRQAPLSSRAPLLRP